jgi:hypothetical protein
MTESHEADTLIQHRGHWTLTCACGEEFRGSDPIMAHDRHTQHQLEKSR